MKWTKDKQERARILSIKQKVLVLIIVRGETGITNTELTRQCGGKWSARLSELRNEGHHFNTIVVDKGKGIYKYVYVGKIDYDKQTPLAQLQTLISKEHFGVVDADRLYELLKENGLYVSSIGNYERNKQ